MSIQHLAILSIEYIELRIAIVDSELLDSAVFADSSFIEFMCSLNLRYIFTTSTDSDLFMLVKAATDVSCILTINVPTSVTRSRSFVWNILGSADAKSVI